LKRSIIVDLDGTLTVDEKAVPYHEKALNKCVAGAVVAAADRGWGVQVLTARGMRTYKNDRALVEEHVKPVASRWLVDRRIPHDSLHVGKPWCGPGGYYVDDRNLHLEEFISRFTGPFAGVPVQLRTTTTPQDLPRAHARLVRLDRWLDVVGFDYGVAPGTLPAVVADDLGGRAEGPADWVLWVDYDPALAPPAAWFAVWGDQLGGQAAPIGHSGGLGLSRFALAPNAGSLAEALTACAKPTGCAS